MSSTPNIIIDLLLDTLRIQNWDYFLSAASTDLSSVNVVFVVGE